MGCSGSLSQQSCHREKWQPLLVSRKLVQRLESEAGDLDGVDSAIYGKGICLGLLLLVTITGAARPYFGWIRRIKGNVGVGDGDWHRYTRHEGRMVLRPLLS